MLKRILLTTLAAAAFAGLVAAPSLLAADAKPKYTVKDVMKAIHKGDENLGKKIVRGQGTADDFARVLDYYEALPGNKPPRGDQSSWDTKTAAMLKAAQSLKSGAPEAIAGYKRATNCKACHDAHKPQDKK